MPARHSKNSGDRHHYTHHERNKASLGSIKQRLGTDSQLPFGYCALSLQPSVEPVATPSGRIYSRESMLEYLLAKAKELKEAQREYDAQQERFAKEQHAKLLEVDEKEREKFLAANDTLVPSGKRKMEDSASSEAVGEYEARRRRVIDDTAKEVKLEELRRVSPWVPQFTPQAAPSTLPPPPKRPPSPFSGQPLRAKDLLPINLEAESATEGGASSGTTRFICPVSRKTITTQKVVLIKSTGAYMLAETAEQLAYPSLTCPVTGKKFKREDVLELVQAASGFSASGKVEAKVHRPSIN